MELAGKTAVLTGAGHGLGRALAKGLANDRCRLVLIDLDATALAESAKAARNCGVEVLERVADVACRDSWSETVSQLCKRNWSVDLLFNNAGVFLQGSFEAYDLEDFEWLMSVNFWGYLYAMRSFLPELRKRPEARIVNVLSCFALVGFPGMSAYCASKFALEGLSLALRSELSGSGVGLSLAYPGAIATQFMSRARIRDVEKASAVDAHLQKVGLSPERVASQILAGVRGNQARIHVGAESRIAELWRRIAPVWGNNYFAWLKKRHPEL